MRIQIRAVAAIVLSLFFAWPTSADKYAVLVCSSWTIADAYPGNSDYWYSLFLAYEALVTHGYSHDHITVLYNNGTDFVSRYSRFRNHWTCEISNISDLPMSDTTLCSVLDSLGANEIGDNDTLVLWWVCGHGQDFGQYNVCISNYNVSWAKRVIDGDDTTVVKGTLWDTTMARYLTSIDPDVVKIVLWATCNAGGMLDDIDTVSNLVGLAGVQWHHSLASVEDTIRGDTPTDTGDTVGVNAFTMYLAYALMHRQLRGSPFDFDSDADGATVIAELQSGVDSMYRRNPYLLSPAGQTKCPAPPTPETCDTSVLLDNSTLASSFAFADAANSEGLLFRWRGQTVGRLTRSGYVDLRDTFAGGTQAGLRLGPSLSLDTLGNLLWTDSLISNSGNWLDTASLANGLLFREPCGDGLVHTNTSDTVRVRAWCADSNPEMQ